MNADGDEIPRGAGGISEMTWGLVGVLRHYGARVIEREKQMGREAFHHWALSQNLDPKFFIFWRWCAKATDAEILDHLRRLAEWLVAQEARMLDAKAETAVQKLNRMHAEAQEAQLTAFNRASDAGRLLSEIAAEVGQGNMPLWLEENFRGTPQEAGRYLLAGSLTPEKLALVNDIHADLMAEAIQAAFNPRAQS